MKKPCATEKELILTFDKFEIELTPLLKKALKQVKKSHLKQKRDDGTPYLEQHIYPIVIDLIKMCDEEKVPLCEKMLCGALLHDVIEDDYNVSFKLFEKEFGEEITKIVKPLTKSASNKKHLSTEEKIQIDKDAFEIIKKAEIRSKLIKFADRANNMQSSEHLIELRPEKFKRYLDHTESLYIPLAKEISPYFERRLTNIVIYMKQAQKDFSEKISA